jgi:hypothetical protein
MKLTSFVCGVYTTQKNPEVECMASAGFEPALFPSEEYTVAPGVKLSPSGICFLLAVHAGFDQLRDPDPGEPVLIPNKEVILWEFATLWVELILPEFAEEYIRAVRASALEHYKQTEVGPCGLDADMRQIGRFSIVEKTFQRLNEKLPSPMGNLPSFIQNLVRRCNRECMKLEERGLLEDPVGIAALGFLIVTLGLGRGKYYRLTRKGQHVRTEIVTGLFTVKRGETEEIGDKRHLKETLIEWDVPQKIAELILRVAGTQQIVSKTLIDPEEKHLPPGDSKDDQRGGDSSAEK